MTRRVTRRVALALVLVLALIGIAPATALTIPGIAKIQIGPPVPGLWDPFDPPYIAPLDLTAPPKASGAHPRLLFSAADLPAMRARVADATSVPGRAFRSLLRYVDAIDPGQPVSSRTFGRQDLADLGMAWLLTKDRAYLDKAKKLLVTIAAAAPSYGANPVFDATEYYNTRAHVLAGLALGWDVLYNDLDTTERALLLSAVAVLGSEHFAHSLTAWWGTVSTGSNFTGNNGAAVGLAGLATWDDLPQARLWFARGRQLVTSYFQEGFDDTGAGSEGVLYGNYGMRIPTYFSAAVERAGAANPLHHPKIRKHTRWIAYEVLPGGGGLNPLNDARYEELNPTQLLWASSRGADPDLAGWIWRKTADRFATNGSVAEPLAAILWWREPDTAFSPEQLLPLHQTFAGRGLVHIRSGWGPDDLMASFEARHNDWGEAIHQNQDVNSFTLYARGARFVVDSGYANYLEQLLLNQDTQAAKSSETEAHNYIEADGRSQDFFGKGHLVASSSGDWIDIAHGDARLAYMTRQPQAADRWFVHLRSPDGGPGSLMLADRFRQDGGSHAYRSYMQTEPGNTIAVETAPSRNESRATITGRNGARLAVTVNAPHAVAATHDTFTADYPGIGKHGRLIVTSYGPAHETLTSLVPFAPGTTATHARTIPARGGIAMAHGTDVVLSGASPGTTASAGGLRSDGVLAVDRAGTRFALVDGRRLERGQTVLVQIDGAPATVIGDGTRVAITGPSVAGFAVWAPGATAVVVNGRPVAFRRCGDYVTSAPRCA